ncbi:MAG: DUF2089 domain-containing protein [Candidatus Firestonebacteria bacterium]|nr:DUF2089 domain-containing protein [Candidatus Firestonebacteria bacterium]
MIRNFEKVMPATCPACQDKLRIARLRCGSCDTVIDGDFEPTGLTKLTAEQLRFVEIFIKSRGSIKDVEAELNISYPTVCKRLDEVITALGYKSSPVLSKREILEGIEAGKITAKEGAELLKKI